MSKYVIDSSTLTGIADAIRAKDGSTSPIMVSALADAISNIPSGGGSVVAEIGDFTFTSDTQEEMYIEHSLGIAPQYIIIWIDGSLSSTNGVVSLGFYANNSSAYIVRASNNSPRGTKINDWFYDIDSESFIANGQAINIWATKKYHWLAIGGI